tara:strand:- start:5160 stop:5549 length:390 start_codon:yes stop_codon:yes gene_type:complete
MEGEFRTDKDIPQNMFAFQLNEPTVITLARKAHRLLTPTQNALCMKQLPSSFRRQMLTVQQFGDGFPTKQQAQLAACCLSIEVKAVTPRQTKDANPNDGPGGNLATPKHPNFRGILCIRWHFGHRFSAI